MPRQENLNHDTAAVIPGIVSHYPNNHVNTLKGSVWTEVLTLLGKGGELVMLDLILDNEVFVAVESGRGNYHQLSGIPLTELQVLQKPSANATVAEKPRSCFGTTAPKGSASNERHLPGNITFVRNRMLHARATLNAKGEVRFGLRHIRESDISRRKRSLLTERVDVLNRFPNFGKPEHTVHVMKYIFPRQFGLHNVFTSSVDPRETVQPFKDYTLREQEIAQMEFRERLKRGSKGFPTEDCRPKVPKRLRGMVQGLISKMQKLHGRSSYTELLRHYCPNRRTNIFGHSAQIMASQCPSSITSTQLITQNALTISATSTAISQSASWPAQPREQSIMDSATSAGDVSAFCRAVVSKIIPDDFWGSSNACNKELLMRNIDRFVHLRRFESLSLHEVVQGMKIGSIPWLIPPNLDPRAAVSQSDLNKRTEIFLEFIYYFFDSLLIPLIRSNFHVTESNVHRNRIFFFRHDVWRSLSEPALANLKLSMLEEMKMGKARSILDARSLGFSQIRLLPKESGVRPIMNLRRRVTKTQNGKVILGRSINSVLAPVFNMLSYEKVHQPDKLRSALFSVGDIYPRVKAFKTRLQQAGITGKALYFAKVDVQSCFDTIPQRRVVELMEKLVSEDEYAIARHAEIKAPDSHQYNAGIGPLAKPARKFIAKARAVHDFSKFEDVVNTELAVKKKNTVFVDSVVQSLQNKEKLLDLLEEHVERNIIKIGKKFYRQKEGIPQGSVLSTLLCSFFYGELERECLGFLMEGESLLLRLIDDFLLITTEKEQARRFLQVMHNGVEKYGVKVNPGKSLVNFEITINGAKIPRLVGGTGFPYCGNLIDTKSLEISKDRERKRAAGYQGSDSLTVEYSKVPGKTFHRKVLNSFKIQAHAMFLDTSFNSLSSVLSNIYQFFNESAVKFYHYVKCLPSSKQPHPSLLT
ncbi:MAG: hypothetical protein M1830_002966, partial [Pleopsidium flavum]